MNDDRSSATASDTKLQRITTQIDRFDQAWQAGQPPKIDLFVPGEGQILPGGASRRDAIIELIKIDLEYRWRRSKIEISKSDDSASLSAAHLEEYVEKYPELGGLDQLPISLIAEEYRVRQLWGDEPPKASFLGRFSTRQDELAAILDRVDEELVWERRGRPPKVSTPPGTTDSSEPSTAGNPPSEVAKPEPTNKLARKPWWLVWTAAALLTVLAAVAASYLFG